MVYINKDGAVVEHNHFNVVGWVLAAFKFLYLFFQTLVMPNYTKHGDKYVQEFRPPGGWPPRPPTRKYGGFGPSGSGPSAPPTGGCGCG